MGSRQVLHGELHLNRLRMGSFHGINQIYYSYLSTILFLYILSGGTPIYCIAPRDSVLPDKVKTIYRYNSHDGKSQTNLLR